MPPTAWTAWTAWWSTNGPLVIVVAGLIALFLVAFAIRRILRSPNRGRWVTGFAAAVVLAWTSEGLWEVATQKVGIAPQMAWVFFFVFEALMLSAAMEAEQHRRRYGEPGKWGVIVWVIATASGTISALASTTLAEVVLRLTLPLLAAGMWWVGITQERETDPPEVIARRAEAAALRESTWTITPSTVLVWLRLKRPGKRTANDAEQERRIRRMVRLADRLLTCPPDSRPYRVTAAQLRRLARTATDADVEEVRQRVARAASITTLVIPGGTSGAEHSLEHDPEPSGTRPGTRPGTRGGTRGGTRPGTRSTVPVTHRRNSSGRNSLRKQAGRNGTSGTAKAEILRLYQEDPELDPKVMAAQVGVSDRYVRKTLEPFKQTTASSTAGVVPEQGNGRQPEPTP